MSFIAIACCIFAAGFAFFCIKFFLLKNDIRQMSQKLLELNETESNAHIRTATFDADFVALAENINCLLEKNRWSRLETKRQETNLKRAVTNISHDLRTPLTSAKGYLQMLAKGNLDEASARRYLQIIEARLSALAELMDGLFSFAYAAEGNLAIKQVNICNLARDALADSFLELESRGFEVESRIPDKPFYCLCDENALARIIQNLVKNACAHGRDFLRIKVADGIIEIANKTAAHDKIDLAQIFERFYTVDASRTNKHTGLGLAISKELARRMDGEIAAGLEGELLVLRVVLPVG